MSAGNESRKSSIGFKEFAMRARRGIIGCVFSALLMGAGLARAGEFTSDSLAEVRKNLSAEKAVLVDVREKSEWKAGHLADATWLPLSALEAHPTAEQLKKRLPSGKIIYTHCARGPRALAAAERLAKHGYDVRPLQHGYQTLLKSGFEKAKP
jgi:rhodanese-related sulfurtransferase